MIVGKAADDILASWVLLPADFDESRAAGRVADVVRAKHSDLMRPTGDLLDRSKVFTDLNLLTIFMTEDGQIGRQAVEVTSIKAWKAMDPRPGNAQTTLTRVYTPPAVPVEAFKVLGLTPDQVGQTGLLEVRPLVKWPGDESGARASTREMRRVMEEQSKGLMVIVRYAWPRRPGEPIGGKPPTPIGPPKPL